MFRVHEWQKKYFFFLIGNPCILLWSYLTELVKRTLFKKGKLPKELIWGNEITTLWVRQNSALVTLLQDILCSKLESPSSLEKITFHVSSHNNRTRRLFAVQKHRTTILEGVPSRKAQKLYNKLTEKDSSMDIFFDPRKTFLGKYYRRLQK